MRNSEESQSQLFDLGKLTLEQLESISQMPTDGEKAQALVELASELLPCRSEILKQALESVQSPGWLVEHSSIFYEVFVEIALQLSEPQRSDLIQKALDSAQKEAFSLHKLSGRLESLIFHCDASQDSLLDHILKVASELHPRSDYARVLATLAPKLHESKKLEVLQKAFDLVQQSIVLTIDDPYGEAPYYDIATTLLRLLPHLPETQQAFVHHQILEIAQKLINSSYSSDYVEDVAAIFLQLPASYRSDIFQQAFKMACNHPHLITKLAPYLPESQREIAFHQAFKDGQHRHVMHDLMLFLTQLPELKYEILQDVLEDAKQECDIISLAFLLPHSPRSQHIEIIQKILHNMAQKDRFWTGNSREYDPEFISQLAPYLPEYQRSEILKRALEITQEMESIGSRTEVLEALAPHLSDSDFTTAIRQHFQTAKLVWDEASRDFPHYNNELRAKEIADLVPFLSRADPQLLKQALEVAQSFFQTFDRAQAVAAIAKEIPQADSDELLNQVKATAQEMDFIIPKAEILAAVAPKLSNKDELLLPVVNEACQAENPSLYREIRALAILAPQLSEEKRLEVFQHIVRIAQKESQGNYISDYCVAIVAKFSPQLLAQSHPDLIEKVLCLKQRYYHEEKMYFFSAAKLLVPYLCQVQPELLSSVLEMVRIHTEFLMTLIPQLPASHRQLLQPAFENLISQGIVFYSDEDLMVVVPYLVEAQMLLQFFEAALELSDQHHQQRILQILTICHPEELAVAFPSHKIPFAFEIVKFLEKDLDKTRFLSALAPRLSSGLISRALRLIEKSVKDCSCKAEAFSNLAPYTSEDLFSELLSLVERGIEDTACRTEALSNLVPYLPLVQLPETLKIVQDLEDKTAQAKALVVISSRLHNLLEEVSQISQEPTSFPISTPNLSPEVLQVEVQKILQTEDTPSRAEALIVLATQLPDSQKSEVLSAVLQTALGLEYEAYRAEILSAIATQVSSDDAELIQQTLELAQQLQDKYYYAATLAKLAPKISERQRSEILQLSLSAVQQIQDPYAKATVLAELATNLPYDQRIEQFQHAINISKQVEYETDQVEAIEAIASHLPSNPSLLQQILEISQRIESKEYRDRITQALGNKLPVALIQQIIKVLQGIIKEEYEKYQSDVLRILAPNFLGVQLPDVLGVINAFQDEGYQAQALQALAFYLSNKSGKLLPSDQEQLNEIWGITARFQQDYFKVKVYSASSTKLAQAKYLANNLFQKFKFLGAEAFLELASYSTSATDQAKALEAIQDEALNSNDYLRAKYLTRLAPYLRSPQQFLEAQLIAQNIEEKYYSVKALSALASYHPEFREQAQESAKQIDNLVQRIELLSILAIETPTILPDIIGFVRKKIGNGAIIGPIDRKHILIALQPHLPARIVREIDRERKAGRRLSDELWNRALKQLARSYREALKSGGLRNDEALDQDLLNLRDEINSLTNLLLLRDLEPPMVVGILGNWGGGKSYIMHLMQSHMVAIRSQALEQQEAWSGNLYSDRLSPYVGHIYQIKFDAWSFAKSNLWASLMQTIFFELNRQISLEQSLQAIGIDPLDDYGNEIWKVLYKTSEDDRQYFLEQTLGKDKLEELKAKGQRRSESWTELLWEQYGVTETIASTYLSQKEKKLNDVRAQLERAKKEKEAILSNLKNKDKQEDWISALLKETTELSGFLIGKYFGKDVAEALQEEVEQKLKEEDIDVSDLNKMAMAINRTVADILEEDTIYIGEDKKKYSLSWLALKKWLKKNQKLIIVFVLSIAVSIILPTVVAQIKSLNIVSQLAALITPLIPAIGFAQALFKSNQKWFTQARQSIQDYEDTLKQRSQDKYHNLIDERVMVNFRQLDAEVQNLTVQEQTLRQEVKQAEAALPKDSFASLTNFVKARVEEATYDNHLGIMQQVRQDLIKLSQALLAPPASSTEYKIKLEKLKKFFPRGPARIVVYIDDLDRCPPDRVVEVLEAIQLLVKTPLFIAVLAIDERYIIRALEKHYAGVLSRRGRPSGEDYLEKIIQIPYRVRPISASALENYLRSQVVIQDTATGGTKFSEVSRDEFNLLLDCCRYVDLSPRTIKRLTNVYKVFKVVCRTRGTKPSRKVQQAIIALLVLSGRHTNLMREVFADMEAHYEGKGSGEQETIWKLVNDFYESNRSLIGDSYSQHEFDRFKQDALTTQLIPHDLTLALLTYDLFNLVRSFSFVGDVGYAAEDFRSVARKESVDQ